MENMKNLLEEALYLASEEVDDLSNVGVRDLQEAGYLTNDKGLFVALKNGKKYLVTVQEA